MNSDALVELKIKIKFLLNTHYINEEIDRITPIPLYKSPCSISKEYEYLVRTMDEKIILIHEVNGHLTIDNHGKNLIESIKLHEKILSDSKAALVTYQKHNKRS
jgi:hypothetical protein